MRRFYSILITLPLVCDPGVVTQRPVLPVAKTGELVVLTRNSAATRYIDSQGRYAGLEYDLVETFAREQGYRVRYLDRQPFYQLLPALERNHAHLAAAGVAITARRLDHYAFAPSYQLVQSVVAYNTDVPALAAELTRLAPERDAAGWADTGALVLGSGGAARAAIAALARLGARRICVRARSLEKGRALEEVFRPTPDASVRAAARIDVVVEPIDAGDRDARFGAIVQATSAGMRGADDGESVARAVAWSALSPDAVALDVVYAPPETPFLRRAKGRGLRADNGFGMLVGQGALAFELWLGVRPPLDVMRAALE